jgi:hypothetical protein
MTNATIATPKKPVSMQLIGPAFHVWDELAVHLRDGYVIQPDLGIELGHNGNAIVNLIVGNPSAAAIDRAKGSNELAVAQQEAEFQRAVKEEAKRLAEQAARDDLEKQVAALKAEQERQIRALTKATETAIANLSK